MILKLKEIHQYTHQLVSSDSEDEPPSVGHTAQTKSHSTSSAAPRNRPLACTQTVKFKEPRVPATISSAKHNRDEEEEEPLSASQGSNTSSTAASEESERYRVCYVTEHLFCCYTSLQKAQSIFYMLYLML